MNRANEIIPRPGLCDANCCPLCGGANHCQQCTAASSQGPCWCAAAQFPEALLARVPAAMKDRACICQSCVTTFHRGECRPASALPGSGDYYLDHNQLMVFTAAYHLRRGYCCGNGCRHCPYERTQ